VAASEVRYIIDEYWTDKAKGVKILPMHNTTSQPQTINKHTTFDFKSFKL
jgi:hypothetical protein